MKNISVFGYGFVGEAYATYLHDYGYNIRINDPHKGFKQTLGHFTTDGAIVCVNAPTLPDGIVDHSNVLSVISEIRKHNPKMPILLKSTVLPDFADELNEFDNVTYSPEFLTAKNAYKDVENGQNVILAGQNPHIWADLFADLGKQIHLTDMRTAAFMKYTVNTFLATKVAFMNEMYDLYEDDWSKLKNLLKTDPRVGLSHIDVPGHDGERGYGGDCFPKDVKAFIHYGNDMLSILNKVDSVNNKWRKS